MILGGGRVVIYLGQNAKNKMMVKIPTGKKKTTKRGDISCKVSKTDTSLLLNPLEKVNGKVSPNILAFKSYTEYVGNMKTITTVNFCEMEPTIFFHKEHWSKILGKILIMKTFYCGNHNIKLIINNQQAVK